MTPTHVELYEALKPSIGEAAARMIAEVVPPTGDLATKRDVESGLAATRHDMEAGFATTRHDIESGLAAMRHDMEAGFAGARREVEAGFARVWEEFAKVRGEIHAESARSLRWMIGLTVTMWAGTWGGVVAILLKS